MLQRFSHGDARLVADLRSTSVQREGLEGSIMLQRFSHCDALLGIGRGDASGYRGAALPRRVAVLRPPIRCHA